MRLENKSLLLYTDFGCNLNIVLIVQNVE